MFSDHQHKIKKQWQILTQRSLIKISNKLGAWVGICHTPETIKNRKEQFCNIQTETDLDDM
jgi:hypothetical protein